MIVYNNWNVALNIRGAGLINPHENKWTVKESHYQEANQTSIVSIIQFVYSIGRLYTILGCDPIFPFDGRRSIVFYTKVEHNCSTSDLEE